MSELQPGTRVRTAAVLSAQDWSPEQNKLRQTGADGTIRAIHTPDKGEPWYEVTHGPAHVARYDAYELTPIRERPRKVAAPTPEQERLDALEQRLWALEQAQDSVQVCRQGADRLNEEAAVAAARAWFDECNAAREGIMGRLSRLGNSYLTEKLKAAVDALPELLRRLEQHEQSPRRRQIQAWQALEEACRELTATWSSVPHRPGETKPDRVLDALLVLDELPDDEPPPDSGERLAQGIRDLTCAPADVSPGDALEAAGWKMEEYGAAASALRVALSVPETKKVELGDLTTEMIRCYRRTTGQLARVRERLANMLGHAPDDITLSEMLTWIESRVMVVRDLCETIPVEALRGVAVGLDSFAGDDYCPAAVVSAALHELAAFEDPVEEAPTSGEETRHVASCESVYCDGCAPDEPELAQPVQNDPS